MRHPEDDSAAEERQDARDEQREDDYQHSAEARFMNYPDNGDEPR